MSMYITRLRFVSLFAAILMTASCATDEYGNQRELTDAEKGVMIGAGIGVLAGLTTKNKTKKAALYGVVGGIAGGAVGSYMDSQKKDFEKQLKTEIDRGDISLQKLPNNVLMVTMTAQTAFDVDSTQIKPGFTSTMQTISSIVKKYGKTHLSLVGHTDSTGTTAYNQNLSERRAESVKRYLIGQGVIEQRLSAYGLGEDKPRADNNTEFGRSLNRRVEIVIEPIVADG